MPVLLPVFQTVSVKISMHFINFAAEHSIYFTSNNTACATAQISIHPYSSLTEARAAYGFIGEPLTLLDCRSVCVCVQLAYL